MLINSSLYYTTAKQPLGQRAYYEPVLVMPNQKKYYVRQQFYTCTFRLLLHAAACLPWFKHQYSNIMHGSRDGEGVRAPPPSKEVRGHEPPPPRQFNIFVIF